MTDQQETYDVAIIGGGLAGLSLAIQCAEAGFKTILFEKEEYPFHKVCGEYISYESLPFLQSLRAGINIEKLPLIKQLCVSDLQGGQYNFVLPLGGFGISRYELDHLLYKRAIEAGAEVRTNSRVNDVQYNDSFSVYTDGGEVSAKVVAGSFGKRSNLDVKWQREFITHKPTPISNYIGVKYHIRYPHPDDEIVLHNFANGYCGMSSIEDGKSCLCYMTNAENLRQSNNSIREMEEKILYSNPRLREIFTKAEFLYDEPLVISQINFEKKSKVENNVLMLGDAAGLISPLCGNGMSMALHSSKMTFQLIGPFLERRMNRQQLNTEYKKRWSKHFGRRLWVGRKVQGLFGGKSTSLFLKAMKMLPRVAGGLIKATHGKAF